MLSLVRTATVTAVQEPYRVVAQLQLKIVAWLPGGKGDLCGEMSPGCKGARSLHVPSATLVTRPRMLRQYRGLSPDSCTSTSQHQPLPESNAEDEPAALQRGTSGDGTHTPEHTSQQDGHCPWLQRGEDTVHAARGSL